MLGLWLALQCWPDSLDQDSAMGSVEPAMARCSDSECGFSVGRTVLGQDAVMDSVAPAMCLDSGWWLQRYPDALDKVSQVCLVCLVPLQVRFSRQIRPEMSMRHMRRV